MQNEFSAAKAHVHTHHEKHTHLVTGCFQSLLVSSELGLTTSRSSRVNAEVEEGHKDPASWAHPRTTSRCEDALVVGRMRPAERRATTP
jgi:hypothetical protein